MKQYYNCIVKLIVLDYVVYFYFYNTTDVGGKILIIPQEQNE